MIYVAITAAIIAVLYIILFIMYSKVFVNKDKYADYMTMPPQKNNMYGMRRLLKASILKLPQKNSKAFLLNHTTVKNCMRDFIVATIALLPLF